MMLQLPKALLRAWDAVGWVEHCEENCRRERICMGSFALDSMLSLLQIPVFVTRLEPVDRKMKVVGAPVVFAAV